MKLILEPRMLFDGAVATTVSKTVADAQSSSGHPVADHAADASHTDVSHKADPQASAVAYAQPDASKAATEILFLDTRVANWQQLAAGARPDVRVVILNPNQDPFQQIDQALQGTTGLTALHFVTHGADGQIDAGNTVLNTATIAAHADDVAAWGNHLAAGADILLWGCDIGAGTQGKSLLDQLHTLTGAQVAASTNATGSTQAGGDWTLEISTGAITAHDPFLATTEHDYSGLLSAPGLTDASGGTVVTAQNTGTQIALGPNFVSSADTSSVTVSLTVQNGVLSLTGALAADANSHSNSLVFSTGTYNGSDTFSGGTLTFSGTLTDVNNALSGIKYTSTGPFTGLDNLQITVTDANNAQTAKSDNIWVLGPASLGDSQSGTHVVVQNTTHAIAGLSIQDSGIAAAQAGGENVTLQVVVSTGKGGLLTVSPITGLTEQNNGTGQITLTGTLDKINTALAGMTYTGASSFYGTEVLTFAITDQNVSNGGPSYNGTITQTVNLTVDAPPTISGVPASTTLASTHNPLTITGISVGDPDSTVLTVELKGGTGDIITLATESNLTVSGDGTNDVILHGSKADINAALNGMTLKAAGVGNDSLTITVNDGLTAAGDNSAISANPATMAIKVLSGPSISDANTTVGVNLNTATAPGGFTVSDSDGATLTATLNVTGGTLSLGTTTGLSVTGNNSAHVTLTGLASDIQTALNAMTYQNGTAGTYTLTASVSDGINTASISPSVSLSVHPAPVWSNGGGTLHVVQENSPQLPSTPLSLNFVTLAESPTPSSMTIEVAASNGILTLGTTTGLTFATGFGNGTGDVKFTGTLAQVQAALASLTYQGKAYYAGTDTVTFTANDGVSVPASTSASIKVTPVDQPPVFVSNGATCQQGGTVTFQSSNVTSYFTTSDTSTASGAGSATFYALDHDNNDHQVTYRLTALPQYGTLKLNGVALGLNAVFTQDQISQITYTNNGSVPAGLTDSFSVSINDGAGQSTTGTVNLTLRPNYAVSGSLNVYQGQGVTPGSLGNAALLGLTVTDPADPTLSDHSLQISNVVNHGGTLMYLDPTSSSWIDVAAWISGHGGNPFIINAAQAGRLAYAQDGSAPGAAPTFDVTATNGQSQSTSTTVSVHVIANDQNPVLTTNTGTTTTSGHTVVLTTAMLQVTDSDSPDSKLTYTVTNGATNGVLQLNIGGTWYTLSAGSYFTQADLTAGNVRYVPQGAGSDNFQFQVRDGALQAWPSPSHEGGIYTDASNTALKTMTFSISNGTAAVYDYHTLGYDTQPAPDAGGASTPSDSNHGTSNDNTLTVYQASSLTSNSNGQGTITQAMLNYSSTDAGQPVSSDRMVYTVTNLPQHGTLYLNGVALGLYATFTQTDINNGHVTYTNNGDNAVGPTADGFNFAVGNGGPNGTSGHFTIQVTPINHSPSVGGTAGGTVGLGGSLTLTTAQVAASDSDGSPTAINGTYDQVNSGLALEIVSLPTYGTLYYNGVAVTAANLAGGNAVLHITNADIAAGKLVYVQNPATYNTNDSFVVRANDGTTGDIQTAANPSGVTMWTNDNGPQGQYSANRTISLSILPGPQLVTNTTLILSAPNASSALDTGLVTTLKWSDVNPSIDATQIQYTVTTLPTSGYLQLNGVRLGLNSKFTEAQLEAGQVVFVQTTASGNSDHFVYSVSDGVQTITNQTYNIFVQPHNSTPTITAPGSVIMGGTSYTFASGVLKVADADLSRGSGLYVDQMEVTISVASNPNAILVLGGYDPNNQTEGSGVAVTGGAEGTQTITVRGTLAQINAALNGLTVSDPTTTLSTFTVTVHANDLANGGTAIVTAKPTGNDTYQVNPAPGSDVLSVSGGTIGVGGALTADASITVNISPVDHAPTAAVPTAQTVNEDTALKFSGITVADSDAFGMQEQVHVWVANGKLTVNTSGITIVGGANGTGDLTIKGTLAQLNTALASLTYQGNTHYFGADTLHVQVNDLGNTGAGGPLSSADQTVDITVQRVNHAPSVSAPTGPLIFGSGVTSPMVLNGLTGFTVADSSLDHTEQTDTDFLSVTVSSTVSGHAWGAVTMAAGSGATITNDGTASVTISGTQAQVNAALSGMTFTPIDPSTGLANYNAKVIDQITVTVNDNGNTGLGGAMQATASTNIYVTNSNDAPVISSTPLTVQEDSSLTINSLNISDSDAFGGVETISLSVSHGKLTLGRTTGITFATSAGPADSGMVYYYGAGTGNGTSSMTITGTISAINNALNGLTYVPTGNWFSDGTSQPGGTSAAQPDHLVITVDDNGNTGGTAKVSQTSVNVTVRAVNDAPVASGATALPSPAEDSNPSGSTVASLIGAGNYSDTADTQTANNGGDTASALQGIAIVGNSASAAQGTWQFSLDNGTTWQSIATGSSINDTHAVVLSSTSLLRFLPSANYFGTPGGLSIRLADSSVGLPTLGANRDLTGVGGGNIGGSGLWSNAIPLTTTVSGVNDAPTASGSVSITDSQNSTGGAGVGTLMGSGTVSYSDATDNQSAISGGGNSATVLQGIAIVGNAATSSQGYWAYSTDGGTSWTAVPASVDNGHAVILDLTAKLRFVPVDGFSGTPGALSVRLSDGSSTLSTSASHDIGTPGGTSQWSAGTVSIAVAVSAVPASTASTTFHEPNNAPAQAATAGQGNAVALDPGYALPNGADLGGSFAASAIVRISGNYQSGEDVLSFTNANGISGQWDAASGTMALTGTATLAQWQAALRSITYHDTSDTPNANDRSVSVQFIENSAIVARDTVTVHVVPADDSPVLDTSVTPTQWVPSTAPTPSGAVGFLVSQIANNGTITDADGPQTGIAIIGADTSRGSWWFSTDNGATWTRFASGATGPSAANALHLLVNANDRLYFQPTGSNWGGVLTQALSFRAWDAATGIGANSTNGASADTGASGWGSGVNVQSAAYSAAIGHLDLTVYAPPQIATSDGHATYQEPNNTPAADNAVLVDPNLTLGDFNTATLASATVRITGNYHTGEDMLTFANPGDGSMGNLTAQWDAATGTLTLSSAGNSASVAQWQAALRSIHYYDRSDTPDASTRTVTFSVSDGKTVLPTSASVSRDVQVIPADDSPIIVDLSGEAPIQAVSKDPIPSGLVGTAVTTWVGARFTDSDGPHSGIAIVNADTSAGNWWYSTNGGQTWTLFASSSLPAISSQNALHLLATADTRIYFQPTNPLFFGSVAHALTFRAWDAASGIGANSANATLSGIGTSGWGSGINVQSAAYSSQTLDVDLVITLAPQPPQTEAPKAPEAPKTPDAPQSTPVAPRPYTYSDPTDQPSSQANSVFSPQSNLQDTSTLLYLSSKPMGMDLWLVGSVGNRYVMPDQPATIEVPPNIFRHTNPGEPLAFEARRPDGGALPQWLSFDARTLTFRGTPPNAARGAVDVVVTARDGRGNAAEATFRILVGRNVGNDQPVQKGTQTDAVQKAAPNKAAKDKAAPQKSAQPTDGQPAGTSPHADMGPTPQAERFATLDQGQAAPRHTSFTQQLGQAGRMGHLGAARALLDRLTSGAQG